MFWIGYFTAIATYLTIGLFTGIYIVGSNFARFHGRGFQMRRMIVHVLKVAVFWPAVILEL